MTEDRTFQPLSAYGSQRWCAVRLGMPYDTFRRQRPNMEKHMGFPPSDPLNGCTIKADVDAWIAKRRRIADGLVRADAASDEEQQENFDAF